MVEILQGCFVSFSFFYTFFITSNHFFHSVLFNCTKDLSEFLWPVDKLIEDTNYLNPLSFIDPSPSGAYDLDPSP